MIPMVTIAILNCNGWPDTERCLLSLETLTYPRYEVVVVDNGSRDGSAEKIAQTFPGVLLIRNAENLGFAAGNNQILARALERCADYIFLLNNDTVVDKDALRYMVNLAESDEYIGIVGPKIYFLDRPEIIQAAGTYISPLTGRIKVRGAGERDDGRYSGAEEMGYASACALLIKRQVVEEIGFLDTDYFHGFEDIDWCLRARRAGYKIMYAPQAKVWHKLAASSGGFDSPFYVYYQVRNRLLLIKKRFSPAVWPFCLALFGLSLLRRTLHLGFKGRWLALLSMLSGLWDFCRGAYGRKIGH